MEGKEETEEDRRSVCCFTPTSVMDGRDGRSQEEAEKQHAFTRFPFFLPGSLSHGRMKIAIWKIPSLTKEADISLNLQAVGKKSHCIIPRA